MHSPECACRLCWRDNHYYRV